MAGTPISLALPASYLMSRFFHKQPAKGGSAPAMTREV